MGKKKIVQIPKYLEYRRNTDELEELRKHRLKKSKTKYKYLCCKNFDPNNSLRRIPTTKTPSYEDSEDAVSKPIVSKPKKVQSSSTPENDVFNSVQHMVQGSLGVGGTLIAGLLFFILLFVALFFLLKHQLENNNNLF